MVLNRLQPIKMIDHIIIMMITEPLGMVMDIINELSSLKSIRIFIILMLVILSAFIVELLLGRIEYSRMHFITLG